MSRLIWNVDYFFLGEISWELELASPIVGMYEWKPDGLQKIPFTTVAEQTLDTIISSATAGENNSRFVGKGKELILKWVLKWIVCTKRLN